MSEARRAINDHVDGDEDEAADDGAPQHWSLKQRGHRRQRFLNASMEPGKKILAHCLPFSSNACVVPTFSI